MLRKMIGATVITLSLGFAATCCGTASEILIDTATETATTITSNTESTTTALQSDSGEDVTISEPGIYILSGTATETTVFVEAGDEAKIQLILDGVDVTNTDAR